MDIIYSKRFQVFFLILFSFGFYFNSLFNEYALDDEVVITNNRLTKKGVSGIKSLVSHHLYYGFIPYETKLGLYRPVSLITHAVEYEFFGRNPFVSHLINVLLYVLIILLLYKLLEKYIFYEKSLLPFLSSLIFAIHPIHTEVVANIKSRDELLSLLFVLLSLICFFSYIDHKKIKYFIASLLFFTLALFSKESAITFIGIIVLIFYYFKNYTFVKSTQQVIPFICVGLFYVGIKYILTGFTSNDNAFILNTPYLYATAEQEFATKIYIIFKYFILLFFPHPLSYDYCYNQIPYLKFSDPEFWLAAIVIILLLSFAFLKFKQKNVISFSILFFFIGISIVSNFIFKIGAPMGERFLFIPSIGFSIAIAYLLYYFIYKVNFRTSELRLKTSLLLLMIMVGLSGYKTITRNADWKNNTTLFLKDVNSAPNSIRTLTNAGVFTYYYKLPKTKDSIQRQEMINDAIINLHKAIEIDSNFPDPYVHLTKIYLEQKKPQNAASVFTKAQVAKVASNKLEALAPDISYFFILKGHEKYLSKDVDSALYYFSKSLQFNPDNPEAHWNLGGLYLEKGEVKKTVAYWERTIQLNPDYPKAQELLERVKKDFAGRY